MRLKCRVLWWLGNTAIQFLVSRHLLRKGQKEDMFAEYYSNLSVSIEGNVNGTTQVFS